MDCNWTNLREDCISLCLTHFKHQWLSDHPESVNLYVIGNSTRPCGCFLLRSHASVHCGWWHCVTKAVVDSAVS